MFASREEKSFKSDWCGRMSVPVSQSRVGERVSPHGSVCVVVNPPSPLHTHQAKSAEEERIEAEWATRGGGGPSYSAVMDEFNRTHWEENEPIRTQWLLLFATNSATSTVPGEKDRERKNELRNALLFYSCVNTFCSSFPSRPLSFYLEHLFFLRWFPISVLLVYCKQQQLVSFICVWNFLDINTHILGSYIKNSAHPLS